VNPGSAVIGVHEIPPGVAATAFRTAAGLVIAVANVSAPRRLTLSLDGLGAGMKPFRIAGGYPVSARSVVWGTDQSELGLDISAPSLIVLRQEGRQPVYPGWSSDGSTSCVSPFGGRHEHDQRINHAG
jgi:hypothetical protein